MPEQRPITIPSGDVRLEGALMLPAREGPFPAVVVCHPHPQYGGTMHNNVVSAAALSLVRHGIAAVLFNFRGAGGSEGEAGDRAEAQTDVRAALAFAGQLEGLDGSRVALAGYSFGAGTAAAVAEASLPALALISLPLSMLEDGAAALRAYPGPLMLLSGDRDEGSAEEGLLALAQACAGDVSLGIVPGADHFWRGYEPAIAEAVGPFFERALAG